MDRRAFLKSSSAATLLSTLPFIAGFSCNKTDIAALVQVLGNSASRLAALQGNTSLAAKLLVDTGAAVTAIDNWKQGSPADMVIEVLNLVVDDLNLFPVLGPYGPLIDLAIGTAEAILAVLPHGIATANVAAPHGTRRPVTLAQPAPKDAKAYKARWNALVAGNPTLASAKIE